MDFFFFRAVKYLAVLVYFISNSSIYEGFERVLTFSHVLNGTKAEIVTDEGRREKESCLQTATGEGVWIPESTVSAVNACGQTSDLRMCVHEKGEGKAKI